MNAPAAAEYREWLAEVRRYVHRLTGDADQADDVAQETLVRYVSARERQEIRSPRAWLFRTATNLVRDAARHVAMRQRVAVPVDDDVPATPEQELERAYTIEQVRAALERIPARDRELLILRESGFRYREIADVIGVKTESVPVLAARALTRLRAAFLEGAGE